MEILDAKIETATASALAKAKPTKRTPADSNQPSANAPTLAAHRGDQLTLENRRFRLGYEVCERNKAAERHLISCRPLLELSGTQAITQVSSLQQLTHLMLLTTSTRISFSAN
ncbi:unnamed protein product [Ceratitis capitata]|uniref:(Mediterranean fruit fly) hypothetical protein n=1 Tax=Ceratitis capitata TaxID=7213 RepID=A0A811VAT5_CERCA|nr:unnamed protein product [Ceratitis capitata]